MKRWNFKTRTNTYRVIGAAIALSFLTAATAVLVNGSYFPGAINIHRNYVKNPDCLKNNLNIDANSGSVVRATDPDTMSRTVCEVDAGADAHWAQWEIDTLGLETVGQECAMSFRYSGDGDLYEAVLMSSADVVLTNPINMENVGSNSRFVYINYPCTAGVKPTIDPTSSSAASFKVWDMTYGLAENLTNGSVYIPWTNYTPTISSVSGTLTNYTLVSEWMRDGENAYYRGSITFTGSPGTWNTPQFTVPGGQTMAAATPDFVSGRVAFYDTGTSTYDSGAIAASTTRFDLYSFSASGSGAVAVTQAAPFTWVSGDKITWMLGPIKITEWIGSGQNVMSLNTLPNITNWASYTPTGAWAAGSPVYTGKWRKVGGDLEGQVNVILGGATTAAGFTASIPSGLTIDTANMISISDSMVIGWGRAVDAGVSTYTLAATYNNTTSISAAANGSSGTYGTNPQLSNTLPFTFGNLDYVSLYYKVPIVGWSATTVDMPLVTNSAVTNYSGGAVNFNYAYGTCSTSASVTDSSITGVTIGNISAGCCTLTLPSGTYSAAPRAVPNFTNAASSSTNLVASAASATSVTVCSSLGGTTTYGFDIFLMLKR